MMEKMSSERICEGNSRMLGGGRGDTPPGEESFFLGFRSPKRRLPRVYMNKNFLKNMPNIFVKITYWTR